MAVKVKCQHCWKIFEVMEDAIGKQRNCSYCSRPTLLKPIDEKNNIESATENTAEHKTKLLLIFSFIIFFISLVNLFLMFSLVKNHVSESAFQEAYSQQLEWQKNIDKQIKSIQQKVDEFERGLQQVTANSKQSNSEINATFISMMDNLNTNFNAKLEQLIKKIEQLNTSK